MKRVISLALCLVVVASFTGSSWARDAASTAVARDYSGYNIADPLHGDVVFHGAGVGLAKSAGDTVFLYGGPGSLNGKFETSTLQPTRQSWAGVDLTEVQPHWNVSTFNAANLGGAPAYWSGAYTVPATNHAMWDGVPAGTTGFSSAPGYGNNFFDQLDRRWNVTSTAAATTLNWDFVFNHDSEPGYDFFIVQWDSAGSMVDLASFDADNRDTSGNFTTPASFSTTLVVSPGMYAGPSSNQVHLRLLFDSDGAWSDEDGLWPTDGGAQVDNIQVNGNNGVGLSQATFEGGADGSWVGVPSDFAGDFSKVFPSVDDIDPCRDNETPQMTFIDDGTPPNNDSLNRTTGGSTSSTWSYGVPGGWVVNYNGGLTLGAAPLNNEVWSPVLAWDLAGTADDAVDGGAGIRFGVWQHLPLLNGIFYVWHVRSNDGSNWTGWQDRNFVYYGGGVALYSNRDVDVRDLLVPGPVSVQMALGCTDLADLFAFPGNDATPSPTFDHAGFYKYNAVGPGIVGRDIDWFQDSFPNTGAVSCTPADDSDLAIRLDMARDIRPSASPGLVTGDSIIADFVPRKPGSSVVLGSIHMEFVLDANPCFAAERAAGIAAVQAGAGSGASDVQLIAPNKYRGYVRGTQSVTSAGAPIPNRYFFDLPDGATTLASYQTSEPAFFFPGDRLRYLLTASTISPAEASTLPADTAGFTSGVNYNRTFRVAGLPTLTCGATDTDACTQPGILTWNDFGDRGGEDELMLAFNQNGYTEFVHFDTYTTRGPSSLVSNGLGSAGVHGANAQQLEGYQSLIYECGDLSSGLISDGSSTGNNDKGNDAGVLTAWFSQPHNRGAAYWGDNIGAGLGGGGITYRTNVMGINFVDTDALSSIGNQTAPKVAPTAAGTALGFQGTYVAYGGCLAINNFDEIGPGLPGAVKSHEFLTPTGGAGAYTPSAGVYYSRQDTIAAQPYTRTNITFPYGFLFIRDVISKDAPHPGESGAAHALRHVLQNIGGAPPPGNVVATDPIASRRLTVAQNRPNPFNPVTKIEFSAPARGKVAVRIYNLRGELVTTLLDGVVEAGARAVTWNGTDAKGASVASGVYLYQVEGFGQVETRKMALVK